MVESKAAALQPVLPGDPGCWTFVGMLSAVFAATVLLICTLVHLSVWAAMISQCTSPHRNTIYDGVVRSYEVMRLPMTALATSMQASRTVASTADNLTTQFRCLHASVVSKIDQHSRPIQNCCKGACMV